MQCALAVSVLQMTLPSRENMLASRSHGFKSRRDRAAASGSSSSCLPSDLLRVLQELILRVPSSMLESSTARSHSSSSTGSTEADVESGRKSMDCSSVSVQLNREQIDVIRHYANVVDA